MTDRDRTTQALPSGAERAADVARLVAEAGPRPPVPAERMERLRAGAREAWRESLERRPRRATLSPGALALAATLALALVGGWWWWRVAPPAASVAASVERATGPVATPRGTAPGTELATGQEVATGEAARLALRMASGHSVRLDAATRVRLLGGGSLELVDGTVYVDSGAAPGPGTVEIATRLGTVREIGTQFEVRLAEGAGGGLRVRVREGAVEVGAPSGERSGGERAARAVAGEELTVAASGAVTRREIAVRGPEWAWASAAAPPIDIEGLALDAYLEWVARETGRPVRYADGATAAVARQIVLHGSLGALGPEASLDALLPGSGLEYRFAADGAIVVAPPS